MRRPGPGTTHGDVLIGAGPVGVHEKAADGSLVEKGLRRGKVPATQGSLWSEADHPRESAAHDGKLPGEFAPKAPGEGFTPRVTVGQQAIGGETVLAEFGSDKGPVLSRRM